MAKLEVRITGELVDSSGHVLLAARAARWALVLRSNAAQVTITMPASEGQHAMLVMPRRAENVFSLLADCVEHELELAFVLRGMPVDHIMARHMANNLGLDGVLATGSKISPGGKRRDSHLQFSAQACDARAG